MNAIIGSTTLFAGNFAPKNWAFCNGQILPIASNTAMFSILGTTYGGNGQTTFALPDLRGRVVVGAGQGPGLANYDVGQTAGAQTAMLTPDQMPAHTHPVTVVITPAAATEAVRDSPVGGVYAAGTEQLYQSTADGWCRPYDAVLTTQNIGNGEPFSILNPVLGLNYIICMLGVFPARN